ncbi:MAG: hypothetical protein GY771_16780 [bacterium]|nr:hypothetical protein [bacterium]
MRRILLLSLSLTVLLGVACKDPVAPEPTYFGLTPSQCIYYLEQAFNDRDIGIFEKQFSPNFIFYFNEDDIGNEVNEYTIPETWDFDHFRHAVWNMLRPFDEDGAYEVSLELPEDNVGSPPDDAAEYTSNIPFSILVMIDEENGLLANKGSQEFVFEKTDNDGEDYWRIKDWLDSSYFKSSTTTMGTILAYWYSLNPLPE